MFPEKGNQHLKEIDRSGYRKLLNQLEFDAATIPNTPMASLGKTTILAVLIMRWELLMVDRALPNHPFEEVESLIRVANEQLLSWKCVTFAEKSSQPYAGNLSLTLEDGHKDLFQQLWVEFSEADYLERISRYDHRLHINGLNMGFLKGSRCIDFGCGHGNFSHALRNSGAASVLGLDFGKENVAFAAAAADRLGSTGLEFVEGSVYATRTPSDHFDFAVQNGVFHHLEDEDMAYAEAIRVLRPGGWMWIYTDGQDHIAGDIQDTCSRILRDIEPSTIMYYLDTMNLSTGKRYHLGDSLNAVYRHTGYDEFVERLKSYGFDDFQRLTGGYATDFDADVILSDRWGREKFGEGDIRVLARKAETPPRT